MGNLKSTEYVHYSLIGFSNMQILFVIHQVKTEGDVW